MNSIKEKVQYFIEKESKNSFVQNYKNWFLKNGYEDCLFLCEDTLYKTKVNLFEYAYGKGKCKNCNNEHTILVDTNGWKGWRKTCSFECEKQLASTRQKGENNTSHKMSIETKNNMKRKMSLIMKNKILNNEFTPNSHNYLTHSLIHYNYNNKIIKFRSSWELIYWINNKHLYYEKIRIKYFDSIKQKVRVYITDFYEEETNTIIEVKPKKYQNQQYLDKKYACIQEGYNFATIDSVKDFLTQDVWVDISKNVLNLNKHIKKFSWIKSPKSLR